MKFNSNNKIIHYNFPTFDSKNQSILPKTFFNFKNFDENNNYKIRPFPKAYPIFHISELESYFKSPLRFKRRNNN